MKIIVDSREKAPMDIIKIFSGSIEIRRLDVGDYMCQEGDCIIERKEQDVFDFQRTLMQVSEIRQVATNPYLFITMSPDAFHNSKRGNKFAKIGFVSSILSQNIPIFFEPNYYRMLTIIHRTFIKNHDGKKRDYTLFNHQRHVTKKDVRLNVLTSLPGVGNERAKLILDHFGTLNNFFNATEKQITSLPGFGAKSAEKIINCLRS